MVTYETTCPIFSLVKEKERNGESANVLIVAGSPTSQYQQDRSYILLKRSCKNVGEYTDKDMIKSLVRTIELLAEENKKLRQEIEGLRAIPVMRFDSESLGLPPVTDKE